MFAVSNICVCCLSDKALAKSDARYKGFILSSLSLYAYFGQKSIPGAAKHFSSTQQACPFLFLSVLPYEGFVLAMRLGFYGVLFCPGAGEFQIAARSMSAIPNC